MKVPMVDMLAGYPPIKDEIETAVKAVFNKANFILGEEVARFEKEFAAHVGAKYAVGVANGTDALRMAGVGPEQVGLINCHGTSTPAGDKIESLAIHRALGAIASSVPVHSTKSMTGHLIGGTSAVEAVADMMCFERGVIHPSVNVENQDPGIDLNVIKERSDASGVDHILSNAFGSCGHNACVVLSRFK